MARALTCEVCRRKRLRGELVVVHQGPAFWVYVCREACVGHLVNHIFATNEFSGVSLYRNKKAKRLSGENDV